jgi:hypothetical protein
MSKYVLICVICVILKAQLVMQFLTKLLVSVCKWPQPNWPVMVNTVQVSRAQRTTDVAAVVLLLTLAALALVWVGAPIAPSPAGGRTCHHSGAWRHCSHRGAVIAVSGAVGTWVQVQLLGQVSTGSITRWPWRGILLLTASRHCSRPHWSATTLQHLQC